MTVFNKLLRENYINKTKFPSASFVYKQSDFHSIFFLHEKSLPVFPSSATKFIPRPFLL